MKNISLKSFDKAVLEGKATWWQMDLPSGKVIFGTTKTDMLGYSEDKFKNYSDFTKLLHKEDYEKAMTAMRDHLEGKKKFYETLYRIKNSNGEYITFYDCGQIINKKGKNITLMGFVWKVDDNSDIKSQMKDFKKLITQGKPSMIDLVKKIK